MKRTLLLTLLALSVVLAGCADQGGDGADDGGDGDGAVGPQMSNAEAEALFTRAAGGMPDRFGFAFEARAANGSQLMTMQGAFDNATDRAYLELKGDPAAFGEAADEEAQDFFREGFAVYTTPQGSLYLVNGTAFVFPPSNESEEESFVPPPDETSIGQFLDPETFLAGISGEESGVNVTSVRPLSYRGKAAVEVAFTSMQDGESVEGKAIVFTSPERLAHVEVENLGGSEATPLDQSTFVGDFYYDDEAQVQIPTEVERALGLAYQSDASPFGGNEGPVTWTFLVDGGIALSEVEVVAKAADAAASEDFDLKGTPSLWTFPLTEGEATHDGVTLAFNDADADGKVSQGDTLVITVAEDAEMPSLVLHDTVTDVYVVPAPGLLVVVALVGALAVAFRKR